MTAVLMMQYLKRVTNSRKMSKSVKKIFSVYFICNKSSTLKAGFE